MLSLPAAFAVPSLLLVSDSFSPALRSCCVIRKLSLDLLLATVGNCGACLGHFTSVASFKFHSCCQRFLSSLLQPAIKVVSANFFVVVVCSAHAASVRVWESLCVCLLTCCCTCALTRPQIVITTTHYNIIPNWRPSHPFCLAAYFGCEFNDTEGQSGRLPGTAHQDLLLGCGRRRKFAPIAMTKWRAIAKGTRRSFR